MSEHPISDADGRLSDLVDRALAGEPIVLTREGRPAVELRPVSEQSGRPVTVEDMLWLARHRVGSRLSATGAGCRDIRRRPARRRAAMRAYLDASVLVALLTNDPSTPRAETFFRVSRPVPVVSDFAAAEFASALSRRVRTAELTQTEASAALSNLDLWTQRIASRIPTTAADIAEADTMLRRLDLPLRTSDALNIALCLRAAADLATFVAKMKICASALGLSLAPA